MAAKIRCSKCGEAIVRDYLIGDNKIFHPLCAEVVMVGECTLFFFFLNSPSHHSITSCSVLNVIAILKPPTPRWVLWDATITSTVSCVANATPSCR
jgi:hypothetical protein